MTWGYHLILDVKACKKERVTDPSYIKTTIQDLVREINMIPYGQTQMVHFGEGDLAGWTAIQLIETSNIIGHFVDSSGDLYLDVFSCREFDSEKVVDFIARKFEPEHVKIMKLQRQA